MNYLSPEEIESFFYKQKNHAHIIKKTDLKYRLTKLQEIKKWIEDPVNKQKIIDAISLDMKRPTAEIIGSEIATILLCIKTFRKNLRNWLKPKKMTNPLPLSNFNSYVHYEPKGNSLIISPWNYPFQLAVIPMIYAISGGNSVIIKPSEYALHTAKVLEEFTEAIFEEKEVKVIQGAIIESQKLLSLPFSHIFFTGSPEVGKIIMGAAAKNLASVTLELGGKSPCIVDESVSIDKVVKSIMWGKCYNTGQTCIAPDYILVKDKIKNKFIETSKAILKQRFGTNQEAMMSSPDLGRIISDRHWNRTKALLDDAVNLNAKIEFGGFHDKETRFFAPTLISGTIPEMKIRKEEIFSPILPIVPYKSLDEAISQVNELPKALTMYIFSNSKKNTQYIIENTSAGSTLVNDTLIHFANENMPFGGVNNSGIGKSHGKHGLYAFMNERSVMKQLLNTTFLLHPPYTNRTTQILNFLSKL